MNNKMNRWKKRRAATLAYEKELSIKNEIKKALQTSNPINYYLEMTLSQQAIDRFE